MATKRIMFVMNSNLFEAINYFKDKGVFEEWSQSKIYNYALFMGMKKIIETYNVPDKADLQKKLDELTNSFAF